jgi:hypothetical protein
MIIVVESVSFLPQNTLNEVRRIQNYLGLNHYDECLQEVINRCSIDNLRNDVDTGKLKTQLVDDNGKSALYRKGTRLYDFYISSFYNCPEMQYMMFTNNDELLTVSDHT